MAVITNDIYTQEDAQFLVRRGALPAGASGRGGDRRLPAHRDPRGRLGEPGGGARADGALPGARAAAGRERRRQPLGDLQPRAGRRHHLRDRRGRRRQDPAQGRARDHALGPARDQQDRPGPLRGRRPRGDGARRPTHARGAALCLHQSPGGPRRRRRRLLDPTRAPLRAPDRVDAGARAGRDGRLRLAFERARPAHRADRAAASRCPCRRSSRWTLADDGAATAAAPEPDRRRAGRRPARDRGRAGRGRPRRALDPVGHARVPEPRAARDPARHPDPGPGRGARVAPRPPDPIAGRPPAAGDRDLDGARARPCSSGTPGRPAGRPGARRGASTCSTRR